MCRKYFVLLFFMAILTVGCQRSYAQIDDSSSADLPLLAMETLTQTETSVPTATSTQAQTETSVPTATSTQAQTETSVPTATSIQAQTETSVLTEPLVTFSVWDPMAAYQGSLEYEVVEESQVPEDLLAGFMPVKSLVLNPDNLDLIEIPDDLSGYVEDFVDVSGIWGDPIAGYNDGFNDYCDDPTGYCTDDIQAYNWRVYIAFELCHPAIGCLRDPDGGAVLALVINRHDRDEVWNVRNKSAIYMDSGFIGYGPFWFNDGQVSLEDQVPHLLNHYVAQLTNAHPDNHLEGQCGDSQLCETVTYAVVYRSWDRPDLGIGFSHFQLVDWGQYIVP